MEIVVNNSMQVGYKYVRTRPMADLSDLEEKYQFFPELTPKEMLELGVFGGKYFNDVVEELMVKNKVSKLGCLPKAPIIGVIRSETVAVITLVKAVPMTTATARSIRLPLNKNFLNPPM